MTLLEMSRFGDRNLSLQKRLDIAFLAFKSFCKSRKISCSQPPFSVKLVFRTNLVMFYCLFLFELCFQHTVLWLIAAWLWFTVFGASTEIVKKHNEILMTGKAYNNRCILEWLADVLSEQQLHAANDRVPLMFLAMMLALFDEPAGTFLMLFKNIQDFFDHNCCLSAWSQEQYGSISGNARASWTVFVSWSAMMHFFL